MESAKPANDPTRRNFLQAAGVLPSLALLMPAAGQAQAAPAEKFTGVDLSSYFNISPREFAETLTAAVRRDLEGIPTGRATLHGIPFELGAGGEAKSWLALRGQTVDVTLGEEKAGFICLAQFCDWAESCADDATCENFIRPGEEDAETLGVKLADAVLVYADNTEASFPVRRRFEVSAPSVPWGQLCFGAAARRADAPMGLNDPLRSAMQWGDLQTVVAENAYGRGTLWIWALQNPHPEKQLKSLRLRSAGGLLMVCGLTLFHGDEHPLRYERLNLYRVTLPESGAEENGRWQTSIDLGIVARTYTLPEFQADSWLAAPDAGIGGRDTPPTGAQNLYVELTAARNATLTLRDAKKGTTYSFDLARVEPGKEMAAREQQAQIEVLEAHKVWLHGKITDAASGKPTAARIAFRSPEGRYIPPYGHRTEINDGWFQDYGGDVKLMDASFAYVDGTFQVELPVGDVFVEVNKGFEYGPLRRRMKIEADQRELNLEISRFTDLRAQGWMTADTHVHFLSPSTAVLEGQAEGLNLINLLAAQWGDLFTNVADMAHGPLTSRDGETTVWVGTENRQHLLGHLGLLGGHGEPVFPMSASGPSESYLGDPVWTSLADWTDACRKREGLVVAVHFPYPTAELAADMVLGKIDAVEIYPYGQNFNTLRIRDWYRYLNCGYRVPCVGGTDKMGAYMAVGANRTYAYVGKEELNFTNWAKAVRRGNTFATTGPLVLMEVDGHVPGDEIQIGSGGGTVEVKVEARGFVPFHRVEIVQNGKVVASREESGGTKEMKLAEKVKVEGPAWIAARCVSKYGPTTGWALGIQGHTSPVYIRAPGPELFSPGAASYMLTLIDGSRTWLDTLATRPDKEQFERVHRVLDEAARHLHERMHKHGA
ncbi:MAG TPA: CehA/McbA family metallohydrolase [Bryobacteraceae bacterium]|nr:CehA/McbA family metallohydrolase [Bryobacteraceae bacterium]